MKQVSAKKSSGYVKGDWDSLIIKKAGNGFTAQRCCDYSSNRKMPDDEKPMIFTEPGALLDYVEKCVGPAETGAHEASEEKGEKE